MFNNIVIVGGGLIGTSLVHSIREFIGDFVTVTVIDPNVDVVKFYQTEFWQLAKITTDFQSCLRADLIIIATPLDAYPAVIEEIARVLNSLPKRTSKTIITDVGSVWSEETTELMHSAFPNDFVVRGHPIAGSDLQGPRNFVRRLFFGKTVYLSNTLHPNLLILWERLGANVVQVDRRTHNNMLAYTSHLPHMISYALAKIIDNNGPDFRKAAGGGLVSVTRLSNSPEDIWSGIFAENREELVNAWQEFSAIVNDFLISLPDDKGRVSEFLNNDTLHEKLITNRKD